jgi:hypothetical protein
MAGGRDLGRRAPRWVDWLICSSGLTSAACFLWRVLLCDGEASCVPVSVGGLLPRLLGVAVLPLVILATLVGKAARRLVE